MAPVDHLARLIAGYLDHMHDAAYVQSVFGQSSLAELDALLAQMLLSGDRQRAADADLFVQDTVLYGMYPPFRPYLPRSKSLRALRQNLRAGDYFTRHQSIHTLRRIGPRSNARYFAGVFPWFLA
jgi:hypothetical protein